ncbi:hypothetical protein [Pseudomonas huanghezhanensis]|uniref:hypothetical protein n=1 Tax=Pseudomonas huanghezhanensis TaxID=3002903 RepID=UPI002286B1A3|nr:hypothetical protein [Pseudomonas sp. BSw22131]
MSKKTDKALSRSSTDLSRRRLSARLIGLYFIRLIRTVLASAWLGNMKQEAEGFSLQVAGSRPRHLLLQHLL